MPTTYFGPIAPQHPAMGDVWMEIDVDHTGTFAPERPWDGMKWFNPVSETTLIYRHGAWELFNKYPPIGRGVMWL